MTKKRRHHYVWRKYLGAWSKDDFIWCLREGKIFKSNLMGVGQKRDFYKLKELSLADVNFIEKVAVAPSKGPLKELNKGWIDTFKVIEKFRDFAHKNGFNDPELEKTLDAFEHNFEEDLHGRIENKAITAIDSILMKDISFYDNDEDCINFAFYLCTQYMRTNRIQEGMKRNFSAVKEINIVNCWSVMRHIYSTNMASVLFTGRDRFRPILILNYSGTPFITGDQPVINTYAAGKMGTEAVDDLEFYYPVSPSIALLISEKEEYKTKNQLIITSDQASYYNKMIFQSSHEQLYSQEKEHLTELN